MIAKYLLMVKLETVKEKVLTLQIRCAYFVLCSFLPVNY